MKGIDDSAQEHDRVADEVGLTAHEGAPRAEQRAKVRAKRAADALTGELGEEAVRQQGLLYGGLIAIAVVMIQPFLTAASLDTSAKTCVVALSVAIPLLAALVMVNRHEAFRRRFTPSITVTITQAVAQFAAFVGIVAGFWHITWVAGVAFLSAALVAMLVHSAGYMRLEADRAPGSSED